MQFLIYDNGKLLIKMEMPKTNDQRMPQFEKQSEYGVLGFYHDGGNGNIDLKHTNISKVGSISDNDIMVILIDGTMIYCRSATIHKPNRTVTGVPYIAPS